VTDDDSEFDLSSMAHEDRLVLACLADASDSLSRSEVANRVALESIDKDGAKYRLEKYIDRGFINQWDPDEHHVGLQHELQGRGRRLGQACLEYTNYETPSELTREQLLKSIHELSATVVDLEEQLDQEVAALREEVEALRKEKAAVERVDDTEDDIDSIRSDLNENVKPELAEEFRYIQLLAYNEMDEVRQRLHNRNGGREFSHFLEDYETRGAGMSMKAIYVSLAYRSHDFEVYYDI
jgi:myosin heavy subunit